MYHKSIRRKRLERKLARCAAMRAAKERKRLAESAHDPVRDSRFLGCVTLCGPISGGPRQDIRILSDGSHRRLRMSINGDTDRPTSLTRLLAMIRNEIRRTLLRSESYVGQALNHEPYFAHGATEGKP